MATAAREEKIQQEGLETVEKFMDERFFRKSPEKSYDRSPTDIRTSGSNSWILKLVDPAQRLISSGSQMLFSSVFRNLPHCLKPPTSSLGASESSQSRKDDKKADRADPFEVQVATNVGDNRNRFDRFGMKELEKTLKRKTFTRSEIDHLTTLLHSRTVDLPAVNEKKRSKFISSIPESNRKEKFVKKPTSEVRMGRQSISTPILSPSVLEEDIYSPAEIARAYMDSKRPKLCPSMRSLKAQGLGDSSVGPSSILFSSKSTDMLLVPSSISQGLKRRSLFLDNDFGSTVLRRRIRQKPNILLSKGLRLPVSARPISVPVNGLRFETSQSSKFGKVQHFPFSIRNSQLSLKPKKNFARKYMKADSHSIPGAGSSSNFTPSRSYKMASKILEQLDKLTPPKEKVREFNLLPVGEKSPPKLSPSTEGGLPLRSLKDVDLPKCQEFVDDDKRSNGSPGIQFHDNQDHTFQNQEKMGNLKPSDPHLRLTALPKDSGLIGSSGDSMNDLGVPASEVMKSFIKPSENKRAFHMGPDKDSIDHDESNADRIAPAMADVREEGDNSLSVEQTANEALAPAKPQTTSEVFVGSPLNGSSDLKTSDDSIDDKKDTGFTFQNASSLCMTSQQETIDSAPTYFDSKDLPRNKQSDPSIFLKNNVTPRKQPNTSSTVFDVGNKVASLTESHAAFENGNKAPYTQCNSGSSYPDVQELVYFNADTSSSDKLDRSGRTCNDAFSSSASISAGLAFSFNSSAINRSLNNGQSISCPSLFSSYSPTASMSRSTSRNIFLSAASASKGAKITSTNNHPSTTNVAPSAPTIGLGTFEDKIKQPVSPIKANETHFSSISTSENALYRMLSFSAAATPSSVNNQLSTPTVISATELAGMSSNLGSSVSLSSSGLAGKACVSSGISFGYSSPAFELFNPGSRLSEFLIVGFTSVPATSTAGTTHVSTSTAPLRFEPSTGAHFSSICPTASAAVLAGSSSKPVLSNSHPLVTFRFSSGNSEEQDISKDNVPVFSQKPISPTSELLNPFQLGMQQTLAEPQNSSPLIASSSNLEVNAGGGFSLGAGNGDMANRRFLKVKRKK